MNYESHLIRKYSSFKKIEKASIVLSVTNPIAFNLAKEFELDCKKYPDLKNKVQQHKGFIKKSISLM